MSKKTVETTASGLAQFTGMRNLSPLDTEEVTELGQYFNKSSGGGGEGFEPTEAQLEAMNSGITAEKVATYDTLPDEDDVKDLISDHFVAGTNVTITDNADGTQTISSSGGGGGFTPDTDQLAAMNSGITSYWVSEFRKVYEQCNPTHVYQNLANDSGGRTGYVYEATGNYVNIPGLSTQAVLQRIYTNNNYVEYAWDVHGNHAIRYSSGTVYNPTWSDWLVLPASELPPYTTTLADLGKVLTIDPSTASGLGWEKVLPTYTPSDQGKVLTVTLDQTSAPIISWETVPVPTPPTAYTAPTAGTGVTDVSGGYVVSNNICTINIMFDSDYAASAGTVLFSGLPVPALKPGSSDVTISTVLTLGSISNSITGKAGAHVYLTQGGNIIKSDESWGSLGGYRRIITGSYLIDTST